MFDTLLKVRDLCVSYGGVEALRLSGTEILVGEGEIVSLLGVNGAGKSTLLRAISGLVHAQRGAVFLNDQNVTGSSPETMVRNGVSHVPENRRVFGNLSVHDNIDLAAAVGVKRGANKAENLDSVYTLFPILKERRKQLAFSLSGGEQQMLAIARAIVAHPSLILLDEPCLGLAPVVITTVLASLKTLSATGVACLIAEQNIVQALGVSARGYVLSRGKLVNEGSSQLLWEELNKDSGLIGIELGHSVVNELPNSWNESKPSGGPV